ncbi:hypothetical protein WJX77_005468 [Trebouxia sp. C0004]
MDISGQAQTFRSQRKRKRISYSSDGVIESPVDDKGLENLLNLAQGCTKLLVFSGSGLSAGSGMSTFSTKGGLYERAQKRFNVSNGKRLFTYSFYEKRKLEALAFFADIYAEARKAKPGLGHRALAQVAGAHKLLRHYTMNIDGLAEAAGMDTWHVDNNPAGQTVEMHGNINQLVCPSCGVVVMMTPALLRKLRSKKPVPCTKCTCRAIRCRIMLYDDAEDDVITPEDVFDIMEEDVQQADLILWVGISFEQSASTAYFRRVRQYLMEANRQDLTRQAIINTTEEAFWNLKSACSNTGAMDVLEVLGSADTILPVLATAMTTSAATLASAARPDQLSHAANEPNTNDQQQANGRESTGQLVGHQAAALGHQTQGQHTTAPSEQTQEAHAAASAEQHSVGLHLNALDQQPAGQRQTASDAGTSSSEQRQDDVGTDSAAQAQHDPEGQAEPAGPHRAAPVADPDPSSAGQESKPDEIPTWLQPMAPLEGHVISSAPGAIVEHKKHEQQQRQEQRHQRARIMPAGTALRTIASAHMPDQEIEQGLGQFDAPLYQQNAGVGSIVAPTEVLPPGQMAEAGST